MPCANALVIAVRYNWPIKVIVFNNSARGFVQTEMEVSGLSVFADATSLVNPNFAEYAKVCGGEGVRVEQADAIIPAIAFDKPFIIDAVVNPGMLSMPPTIKMEAAWGFGVSKLKEGILGLQGDHEMCKLWRDEFRANLG